MCLNKEKWAYIAGYVDADGCISLTNDMTSKNAVTASLGICSVHKHILDWILQFTNVGTIHEVKMCKSQQSWKKCRQKKQWKWRTSNNGMRDVLPNILPYLKLKHRQAELTLEYLDMVKKRRGYCITNKDRKRKKEIVNEMKTLNHRGIDVSE